MAKTSTYLNFPHSTEEAFNFYKSAFKTDFEGEIHRFGDMPPAEDAPKLTEEEKNMVMHIALPITGGHYLMGTDSPDCMGTEIKTGNNIFINLQPDTRNETKRLFEALAEGGKVTMELQDMFWGDYHGSLTDKYGVQWMFNCAEKA